MPKRFNRFLISLTAVLALAPFSVRAQDADEDPCANGQLPLVLNIGLPRLPDSPKLKPGDLEKEVKRLFEDFYGSHGICRTVKKIQVNITVASEYEILDWLGQDLIDAAVVPNMTVFLLTRRDGVSLKEMEIPQELRGSLILPAVQPKMLSGRLAGGRWQERRDPNGDFMAFLEEVWQQALKPSHGDPALPVKDYRIGLASHLSTPGFLDPLSRAATWLKGREKEVKPDQADRFWQTFFASAHFALGCDSLDRNPKPEQKNCWRLSAADEEGGKELVEILFPGENALRFLPRGAEPAGDPRNGEHLVIATQAADKLFEQGLLRDAAVELPPGLPALFEAKTPLSAFSGMLDPEPSFGVRTFGFSVDEVFRLLHRHQIAMKSEKLALVLPGGGVKAAYQSRILDDLYKRKYLKNFRIPKPASGEPLNVQYVIGTSGGALLGFFVSQIGEKGPWDLSRILWKTGEGTAERFLESTDIFNWTDLLRYMSVIASFLVLCGLMAFFSIPERSPLSPRAQVAPSRFRPRLTSSILLLLLVAPFLVRISNGEGLKEQIPEFEGMIYAVLAMIAMFADQSMIHEGEERPPCDTWLHPVVPVVFGGMLVLLPLLARAMGDPFELLTTPVLFGVAFGMLAPLVLLGGIVLPLRSGLIKEGWRGWVRLALDFLVPAGVALALYSLLPGLRQGMSKIPFFLAGFLLVLVLLFTHAFLGGRKKIGTRWWPVLYRLALFGSAVLLLRICCGDPAQPWRSHAFKSVMSGTFLLCIGLLLLMVGVIAWIYASNPHYHLRLDFFRAYFVVLLHAVVVYGILCGIMRLPYGWLTPLELTVEFWTWLLLTSLILGSVLMFAGLGRLGHRSSKTVRYLRGSLELLCSNHPNGNIVTRRFLRLAAFSVFSLGWWNLIVAPALYGNGAAHAYLKGAVVRFEAGQDAARNGGLGYLPTARFIAPANNLEERDGTRYFLFTPPGSKCPPVPRTSGAKWLLYEAGMTRPESRALPPGRPCATFSGKADDARDFLHGVIFASGSPFPIFPAHRLPGEDGKPEPLVDGGYSNNVPVDLALKVSADQVLIVDSTSPLPPESPKTVLSSVGSWFFGDLVKNLGRLPAFLFERSQQVDRLSRSDLLVVSLAPSPDAAWPALFDFRGQTVEKMETTAERDLQRRIGLVESWGRPRFQLNVPVEGQRR